MIKEVTYYDTICDCCGKSLTEESEMCYPDTESAEMVAKDSEWLTIGGKHYCPRLLRVGRGNGRICTEERR